MCISYEIQWMKVAWLHRVMTKWNIKRGYSLSHSCLLPDIPQDQIILQQILPQTKWKFDFSLVKFYIVRYPFIFNLIFGYHYFVAKQRIYNTTILINFQNHTNFNVKPTLPIKSHNMCKCIQTYPACHQISENCISFLQFSCTKDV